ncbi:GNAT family N-acetyltransferase (plasmid) [Haloferacaceae archaeon DSL9]
MSVTQTEPETQSDPYTIRPYERGDTDGFLDLFDQVFGGRMSDEWFRWKYEANPYADEVPIIVAEHEDTVVGAAAFFALGLRAGDDDHIAFQPCDTMVHPDHQRRGLFTRMTEVAVDRYAGDVELFFNFPNPGAARGYSKLDWQVVEEQEWYYRIQNPTAWLPRLRSAESAIRGLTGAYLSARDLIADSADEFDLYWHEETPVELLASLAASATPERFHVVRDESFYRWRFQNPLWTYRTVVAVRDEIPVGAVVAAERTRSSGYSVVRIVDALPLAGGRERTDALTALVDSVLARHRDADIIVAPSDGIPTDILSDRSFYSDKRAPLSWIVEPTTHVVRPVDRPESAESDGWKLGGSHLAERTNWQLALCEVDSG